jgi:hypothetical protein
MRLQATDPNRRIGRGSELLEYITKGFVCGPLFCVVCSQSVSLMLFTWSCFPSFLLSFVSHSPLFVPTLLPTSRYISRDTTDKSVSKTLEYAYDDWAVGTFAALLGQSNDSQLFLGRALNYQNVWHASNQFMCPRTKNGVSVRG